MGYPLRVIRFPATRQSVLDRVRSTDGEVRRAAFGDLSAAYWTCSCAYLRGYWRLSPEAAEDAVQAFFATAFEKQYVERYDPAKGRFRTFLRVCLDRFVQNLRKAERAQRRGGGATLIPLDESGAERNLAAHPALRAGDPDEVFHAEMVRALFGRAVEAVKSHCEMERRPHVFAVFDRHDIAPAAGTSYASVAADLGLTVSQVTNALHRARRLFRDEALRQLRGMTATDAEFRAEARELFGLEVEP